MAFTARVSAILLLRRQAPLAACYGAFSALALSLPHPEGTIALLWGASALLIAALFRTSPRHWWAPLTACIVPGAIYSAALGLDLFLLLMFINAGEAAFGAWFLRRGGAEGASLASHKWLKTFVIAAFAAPMLVSPLVAGALLVTGHDHLTGVAHYVAGHGLGNLIFTPWH
jgi:integral membrane sensor domain MASE1